MFNNTYKFIDSFLPYDCEITQLPQEGFGRQNIKIFDKVSNKTIIEYIRNYSSYGDTSWTQFKYKNKWYLIISEKYYDFRIIDPETLNTVATLDKEKTGCNFCPVNFYIPNYVKFENFGINADDDNITGEFGVDRLEQLTKEHKEKIEIKILPYLIIAGVWWAADYNWEIYHIDLEEIMNTGIIEIKNKMNFEIPRDSKPIIRDYLEIIDLDLENDKIKYLMYQTLGVKYQKIDQ